MIVTMKRNWNKHINSPLGKPKGSNPPHGALITHLSKAQCPGRLAVAGPLCSWHCGRCDLASWTSRHVSCPSQWPLSHCPRWLRSPCHSDTLAGLCSVLGRWARVLQRRLSSPWIRNAPCTQHWKQEVYRWVREQDTYRTGEKSPTCYLLNSHRFIWLFFKLCPVWKILVYEHNTVFFKSFQMV